MSKNFAVIGVGGYIAPRHLRAIRDTGNRLVAAVDPKDSVGVLDQYSYDVKFFTEIERFDRHLEKLRRGPETDRVHFVSICSPNYLHDSHCRLALRAGADVICEKPLVINPWNLDALEEIEAETKRRIHTILQLRVHPALIALRESLQKEGNMHDVELTYITSRGPWYQVSWKGHEDKSGGVATNIGIHFFDLLMWLFGSVGGVKVHHADEQRMSGFIELERARVRWYLSVDKDDLPASVKAAGKTTYRSITVDGKEVEFSEGFTDLHTRVYEEILAGHGFGIKEARPSVELTHKIRSSIISPKDELAHPFLKK
ncbi:MAG: Gfo/Idh/MocA family oxidoreductase [Chloroflexi bacterium]|nr:Gfo/Idh/MocA family oxidoreductase [Chloroflexota bacterium]